MAKVGVWLIGAQGSLASTVVLGARALARGLAAGGGLVTELPELARLPLVGLGDLAFGGWTIAPAGWSSTRGRWRARTPRLPSPSWRGSRATSQRSRRG